MCTISTSQDRAVVITGGEGADGVTITVGSRWNPGGASAGMVRDALAADAATLYDALVANLPVTTLRALTSLMIAGLAGSLEPRSTVPGKGAGWVLAADAGGPRIDTIGIDEVLPPGDAGDLAPAAADMLTSIGALIDDYRARTRAARKAPNDDDNGDPTYLSGVLEGLRIARRAVIRPAVTS